MSRETSNTRPRARGRLIACGVLIALLAGCEQQTLAPPPPRLTSGIVIFQDAYYGEPAAWVTTDVPFLRGYGSPCVQTVDTGDDPYFSVGSKSWSHCISSVRVAAGWKAILYTGNEFKGSSVEVTADAPDLRQLPGGCGGGDFNDCVSSIRVARR